LPHADEDESHRQAHARALAEPAVDLVALEKDKIKGAIRTDFVLSAEIIAITLGAVAARPLPTRIGVLVGMSLLMTVGVYGLVAGIVKLDDVGLHLSRREGLQRRIGQGIVSLAPYLMKGLSIVGTIAMFLVGGGILVHGIPGAHEWIEHLEHGLPAIPGATWIVDVLANLACGFAAGALAVGVVEGGRRLLRRG
jgi:predicted DNA repair protein MutK